MNFTVTGMALLAVVGAVIPVIHLYTNRTKPGAVWLLALCLVMAAYPLDVFLRDASIIGMADGVRHRFSTIGLIAPLYLLAMVAYLRLRPPGWALIRWALLVYLPVAFFAPWLTGDAFVSFPAVQPDGDIGRYVFSLGIVVWVMKGVSYVCIVTAAGMLLRSLSSARSSRSYLLSLALFPLTAGLFDLIAGLALTQSYGGVTPVQVATTFGLFALSYALLRQQMLARAPVPKSLLTSHLSKGVCVISVSGEIVDCNQALADILGVSLNKLLGGVASHVLPEALLVQLDLKQREGEVVDAEVMLESTKRCATVSAQRLHESDPNAATVLSVTDIVPNTNEMESVPTVANELQEGNGPSDESSNTDQLTGLGNRRRLHDALANRSFDDIGTSVGLIMVDIDHFKAINETHGHSAGDAVLIRLAGAIREICRDSDLIVRWGGEEFVVLLSESNEHRLHLAAERLRLHIRRLVIELENGVALQVTASIGATLIRPGQSSESALRQVDRLLHEAKKNGRDQVKSSRKLEPEG